MVTTAVASTPIRQRRLTDAEAVRAITPQENAQIARMNSASPKRVCITSPIKNESNSDPHDFPAVYGPCMSSRPSEEMAIDTEEYRNVLRTRAFPNKGERHNNETHPMRSINPRKPSSRRVDIGFPRGEVVSVLLSTSSNNAALVPVDFVPISKGNAPVTGCPSALTTRHTTT